MSEKITKIEQSIWSIKINSQPLYKKYVDGIPVLLKMTPEENEKVAEVLEKAITSAKGVLANRESKRESLAKREAPDEVFNVSSKESIWTVWINTQLLYKKMHNGRTILFGMNEGELKKVANIMDNAIDELAEILKDRTKIREIEVQEKEQITVADPGKYELDMKIEEAKFETKKEFEEKAKKAKTKDGEPLHEKIKEATENDLRKKIQEDKKENSKTSFWDNLK